MIAFRPLSKLRSPTVRRRPLLTVAGLGLAVLAAGCSPISGPQLGTTGPLTGAYAKNVFGVDVASYQHPNGAAINWSSVRNSGASFAFVKVSEGSDYTNSYARADLAGAQAAGLRASGYHFARPRFPLSTATSDAQRFAAAVGNVSLPGSLPPVLDIEVTGGLSAADVTTWTHTFLSTLEATSRRTPMIYSGAWFWRGYLGNPSGFARYPVWASDYSPSSTGPNLFGDFGYSTVWQYTDGAQVGGISGAVDGNWFHGTRTQLDNFAYVATGQPVSPTGALTLNVASSVGRGAPLWLAGKLTDSRTGAALGGKTYSLWRKTSGQANYAWVGSGRTTADGTAFYATTQTSTTTYQLRVDAGAAGAGYAAVASPTRTVTS